MCFKWQKDEYYLNGKENIMPSSVVKGIAKKTNKSTSDVESNWEKAKEQADKKFKGKKDSSYWAYVNKVSQRMSGINEEIGSMSSSPVNNDVRQGLENTLRSGGEDNATQLAQSSIDLAQAKIPNEVDRNSPDYATMLSGLANKYAGTQQDVAGQPRSVSNGNSIMGNSMFPAHESYKSIEQIYEDNYYQHNSVVVSNSGSDMSYESSKDKFDFSLSSNSGRAVAIAVENGASFEVKLQLVTSTSTLWPHTWSCLEKGHNIQSVMKLTVNQLTMDSQYMRSDDTKVISSTYYNSLYKTISSIVKAYIKLWGKTSFQIMLLATNKGDKVEFIDGLAKELSKISGFSTDDKISDVLHTQNPIGGTVFYYVALKNSSGKPIKEETIAEDVTSDAFIGTVPENATVRGQTGAEINRQAKKNVDNMSRNGVSIQLEQDTDAYKMKYKMGSRLKTAPSITHQKANRMYYLRYKDGTVESFDNLDNRDAAKETNEDSEVIRASDYFNSLIDHVDSALRSDSIDIDDEEFDVNVQNKE